MNVLIVHAYFTYISLFLRDKQIYWGNVLAGQRPSEELVSKRGRGTFGATAARAHLKTDRLAVVCGT